jgi:hypothetical protein
MTDPYENIRKALEMGPTPGPWVAIQNPEWPNAKYGITSDPSKDWVAAVNSGVASVIGEANAHHIAACDPDTIRELLAERDQLDAALEAARADAERLAFLAIKLVVEGFVGGEKHIYDYACDAAEESGRDEPSEADMLAGLRRMIDAAIDKARGKGGQEVGDG